MAGCKEDGKENDWGDRTAEVMSSHDRRERSKGSEVDSVSEKSASELQTCSVWAGHTEGSCWQPLSSQLGNRVAKGVPSMGKAGRGNPQTSQLWNKEHLKFPWVWRLKDGNVSVKQNVVNIYTQWDITQPKKWKSCHLWQRKWTLRALCEVK